MIKKSVTDSLTDSDPDLLHLEMLEQLKTSLVPSDSNVWCKGGAGTALSHWERRIFHNEAMTGSVLPGSVLSRLSLALLEDSGWYIPHYDLAQPLTWGAGAGCDFASKSCMELLEQQDSHYCSIQHRNLSCTSDLTAAGVCNLVEFGQDLPEIYQNIKTGARLGGLDTLADYCPYVEANTRCEDPVNTHQQSYDLQTYGAQSKCFTQVRK